MQPEPVDRDLALRTLTATCDDQQTLTGWIGTMRVRWPLQVALTMTRAWPARIVYLDGHITLVGTAAAYRFATIDPLNLSEPEFPQLRAVRYPQRLVHTS
jgi:hypothetical protein